MDKDEVKAAYPKAAGAEHAFLHSLSLTDEQSLGIFPLQPWPGAAPPLAGFRRAIAAIWRPWWHIASTCLQLALRCALPALCPFDAAFCRCTTTLSTTRFVSHRPDRFRLLVRQW
jgi:hypothetical protein